MSGKEVLGSDEDMFCVASPSDDSSTASVHSVSLALAYDHLLDAHRQWVPFSPKPTAFQRFVPGILRRTYATLFLVLMRLESAVHAGKLFSGAIAPRDRRLLVGWYSVVDIVGPAPPAPPSAQSLSPNGAQVE